MFGSSACTYHAILIGEQQRSRVKFTCSVSYLEIYNERLFDLLDASSTGLQLREDALSGVYVQDLTQHEVRSPVEALEVWQPIHVWPQCH